MKIVVSYLSSNNYIECIDKINKTDADGIHADLIDEDYINEANFDINTIDSLFVNNKLPLEFHLMVNKPEEYLKELIPLKPSCIYIHPDKTNNYEYLKNTLRLYGIKVGIAINPSEDISKFKEFYSSIDRVLIMSVAPGAGGQFFIPTIYEKINYLIEYKNKYKYDFEVYVDGGVTPEVKSKLNNVDGVVVGSFITKSDNYQEQINMLKNI